MSTTLKQALTALAAGLLFGTGLIVSGMTQPQKVLDFLDPFGQFDASLMVVMASALAVHIPAYLWVKRHQSPLFGPNFMVPKRSAIDSRLVLGASVFGIGWGLGGFCPGPALVALPAGGGVIAFVLAMVAGMFVATRLETSLAQRKQSQLAAEST